MSAKRTKIKDCRTSCLYIQHIPANLKSYFKAYCAKQEKTMRNVILEFMQQCTKTARHIDDDTRYGSED